jgi:NAD+ kinase
MLPLILCGDYEKPSVRRRIQCLVQSTYKTTRLPPALNDLLLANPIPAGVSRFRLGKMSATATGFFNTGVREDYGPRTQFSINAWSSGMWVCTPTGSTAAMKAAGGVVQATSSSDMQYMVMLTCLSVCMSACLSVCLSD